LQLEYRRNQIQVDASTVKTYLHYEDGRRELSLIFNLKTQAMTREAFFLTDDFLASNRLLTEITDVAS
jgi:hypothetical protein